jgi:hypothetical protein
MRKNDNRGTSPYPTGMMRSVSGIPLQLSGIETVINGIPIYPDKREFSEAVTLKPFIYKARATLRESGRFCFVIPGMLTDFVV